MKSTQNFLLVLLFFFLLFATNSFATNDPGNRARMIFYVNKITPKNIQLNLANLLDLKTSIQIKGVNGKTWFQENVRKEAGYAKNFNLNKLPEGDYFLIVEREEDKVIQFFSYGETGIALYAVQRYDEPRANDTAESRNDF